MSLSKVTSRANAEQRPPECPNGKNREWPPHHINPFPGLQNLRGEAACFNKLLDIREEPRKRAVVVLD